MFTIRHLPAIAKDHPNAVLRYYYRNLLRHWSAADRTLARSLCFLETGFSGFGEQRALGISQEEWSLAAGRVDPRQMLTMRARKGVHRLMNSASFPLRKSVLKNKNRFDGAARAAELQTPDSFNPAAEPLAMFLMRHQQIMIKPNFSSKGKGVRRLCNEGVTGWRESQSGNICEVADIEAVVKQGAILQEAVPTHPAIAEASPNALPTMRVVTMLDEAGQSEIVGRILRVGGGEHPVDNFNRGGLAAIARPGGSLDVFYRHDGGQSPCPVHAHPASGVQLPHALPRDLMSDIDRLAMRAHDMMVSDHVIVGWDIGLGRSGAVLIEGNWNPGTNVTQLLGGESVCTGRPGELYLHALRHVPEKMWAQARPIQKDNS